MKWNVNFSDTYKNLQSLQRDHCRRIEDIRPLIMQTIQSQDKREQEMEKNVKSIFNNEFRLATIQIKCAKLLLFANELWSTENVMQCNKFCNLQSINFEQLKFNCETVIVWIVVENFALAVCYLFRRKCFTDKIHGILVFLYSFYTLIFVSVCCFWIKVIYVCIQILNVAKKFLVQIFLLIKYNSYAN